MGSVYWTAVTYGAVTVMQVLGHKQGLSVMEQADPLFLLVGLPSIPVVLVLARMVRWEDYLLRLWWRHSAPLAKLLVVPPHDPVSATRLLCGALLLPTVASLLGRLFFSRQEEGRWKFSLGQLNIALSIPCGRNTFLWDLRL
ncbi:E3 ubiquitin protein ligase MARCH5, putative [Ixodes scapularis]|uniref:E3 ubiquitin protein ligase MARCH5, putative n=1 Tax=Ixodes scapularis TaxID=6945 RepID=B7PXJ4_IXOSC|nr:E3 ubiquitin protein ligase MARCH5, putative [Ixodes scapularis]|eukprot:XP_002400997.1 E3 ubiquitin protein ligase MARCH5, putative [Ixodes scapularis]